MSHGAAGQPVSRDLFVELIDFSRRGDEKFIAQVQSYDLCHSVGDVRRLRYYTRAASGPGDVPGAASDGGRYLVLELGLQTLEDFLSDLGAPPRRADVRRIFRELCEAVAALHAAGFAHLDVKPANAMCFPRGRFKLIDMDGLQRLGARVGVPEVVWTAKYCAPEVARALLQHDRGFGNAFLEVSGAADVFSLGLVGAELASLRHPLQDAWDRCMHGEVEDENAFFEFVSSPGRVFEVPPAMKAPTGVAGDSFDDLLGMMLLSEPAARPSMQDVLAHSFFREGWARNPQARHAGM